MYYGNHRLLHRFPRHQAFTAESWRHRLAAGAMLGGL